MLTNVAVALFLAAAVERIVEHLVAKPMEQKLPEVDRWFLMYVALGCGGALSFVAGLNIFPADLMPEMAGMVLTAVLVGGGSELLHDVVNVAPEPEASVLPAGEE